MIGHRGLYDFYIMRTIGNSRTCIVLLIFSTVRATAIAWYPSRREESWGGESLSISYGCF